MYIDKSVELKYVNKKLEDKIRTIIENSDEPYSDFDKFFETFFLDKNTDEILLKSLQLIEQSQGNIPVLDLANSVDVHPKKLERLFIKSLGVSVKKFSKIKRLGEMHRVLSAQGMVNIVDTILDKGYFDQAHFNRDFKKLTGVTPSSEIMSILYKTKENYSVKILKNKENIMNKIDNFIEASYINVNGVTLEVFESGKNNNGKAIVLCHGWPEHAYT